MTEPEEQEPWRWAADLAHTPGRPMREPGRWGQPRRTPGEQPPSAVWLEWFLRTGSATWELYRRHGWDALVVGPLPGHTVSGVEQTEFMALLLSERHPAAVDGACAGITDALVEILGQVVDQLRWQERLDRLGFPSPAGPPPISGGLAFPQDGPPPSGSGPSMAG